MRNGHLERWTDGCTDDREWPGVFRGHLAAVARGRLSDITITLILTVHLPMIQSLEQKTSGRCIWGPPCWDQRGGARVRVSGQNQRTTIDRACETLNEDGERP